MSDTGSVHRQVVDQIVWQDTIPRPRMTSLSACAARPECPHHNALRKRNVISDHRARRMAAYTRANAVNHATHTHNEEDAATLHETALNPDQVRMRADGAAYWHVHGHIDHTTVITQQSSY